MGWFDDKANAPGVISATMANDTTTLNGAASEGLATQFNASFALLVGIFLGFFFSWQMTLVAIGCVPLLVCSTIVNV